MIAVCFHLPIISIISIVLNSVFGPSYFNYKRCGARSANDLFYAVVLPLDIIVIITVLLLVIVA